MTEGGGRHLDVLVRFTDLGHLPRLEQCVFALLGQVMDGDGAGGPSPTAMQVHVLLPRFSFSEVESVRAALHPLRGLSDAVSIILHSWDHPEPHNLRVPMLNLGLERARGRYLGCLEIGDVMLPGGYARLLARLQRGDAAIALGGLATQQVEWWGDVVLPLSTASAGRAGWGADGFAFLLDRTRVALPDLVFRVARPMAEVEEFVERIRLGYGADLESATDVLGVRQVLGAR